MNQINDRSINVGYHDVVKCRLLYELCSMKHYCFLVVIFVDDVYDDDSFDVHDLLIVWM